MVSFQELQRLCRDHRHGEAGMEDPYWHAVIDRLDERGVALAVLARFKPEHGPYLLDIGERRVWKLHRYFHNLAKGLADFEASDNPLEAADVFANLDRVPESVAYSGLTHDFLHFGTRIPASSAGVVYHFLLGLTEIDGLEQPYLPQIHHRLTGLAGTIPSLTGQFPQHAQDFAELEGGIIEQLAGLSERMGRDAEALRHWYHLSEKIGDADTRVEISTRIAKLEQKLGRTDRGYQALKQVIPILPSVADPDEIRCWEFLYYEFIFRLGLDPAQDGYRAKTDFGEGLRHMAGTANRDRHQAMKEYAPVVAWLQELMREDEGEIDKDSNLTGEEKAMHVARNECDRMVLLFGAVKDDISRARRYLTIAESLPAKYLSESQRYSIESMKAEMSYREGALEQAAAAFRDLWRHPLALERAKPDWLGFRFRCLVMLALESGTVPDVMQIQAEFNFFEEIVDATLKKITSPDQVHLQRNFWQLALEEIMESLALWQRERADLEDHQGALTQLWNLLVRFQTLADECNFLPLSQSVVSRSREGAFHRGLYTYHVGYGNTGIEFDFDTFDLGPDEAWATQGQERAKLVADLNAAFMAMKMAAVDSHAYRFKRSDEAVPLTSLGVLYFAGYSKGKERCFYALVREKGLIRFRDLGTQRDIDDMLEGWIAWSDGKGFNISKGRTRRLSELFIDRLSLIPGDDQPGTGCTHDFYLEPPLAGFPLELLNGSEGTVGAEWAVRYVLHKPSHTETIAWDRGALILTDPATPPALGLEPLVGAGHEADIIARTLPGLPLQALCGTDATRQSLMTCLHENPPAILHLCAHGSVDASIPEAHCLFLAPNGDDEADCLLAYRQVARLPLSGVQLVVLTACWSGVGKARRGFCLDGLARAFLLAGADNVLAHRRQVPDRTDTAPFLECFYGELRDHSPAEALRLTRNEGERKGISKRELAAWTMFC